MGRLETVKKALVISGLVVGSLVSLSGVASAWGYPRLPNRALESLCTNPDFFESIAAGIKCRNFNFGGGWRGRNHYPTFEESDRFSPDRFFERLEN